MDCCAAALGGCTAATRCGAGDAATGGRGTYWSSQSKNAWFSRSAQFFAGCTAFRLAASAKSAMTGPMTLAAVWARPDHCGSDWTAMVRPNSEALAR